MGDLVVAHTEIITSGNTGLFSQTLLQTLENFTKQHFLLKDITHFRQKVLAIDKPGKLALFYDNEDQLIAFTRLIHQVLTIDHRKITVFTGGTYNDPRFNQFFTAAKFGFNQAMQYKLEHPQEDLVYFANANTPARYDFLANITNTYYPAKGVRLPDFVASLVKKLKETNHWDSNPKHPMLIDGQLPPINPSKQHYANTDSVNYYLSLNPEFTSGTALLVYMPLNLASISQGISKVYASSVKSAS